MNAVELRRIADLANRTRAAQLKREKADAIVAAEAHRLREAETRKHHWLAVGIPRMLDKAKQAAEQGLKVYEDIGDGWPDYVIEHLRGSGFEVEVSEARRWGWRESRDKYWSHTLILRW